VEIIKQRHGEVGDNQEVIIDKDNQKILQILLFHRVLMEGKDIL
jgi:hypothetical protein